MSCGDRYSLFTIKKSFLNNRLDQDTEKYFELNFLRNSETYYFMS